MKYYHTSKWEPYVHEVEVSRTTDKCVYTVNARGKEERRAIKSEYSNYYPTWEEAIEHVRMEKEEAVNNAEERLSRARIVLATVLSVRDSRGTGEATP